MPMDIACSRGGHGPWGYLGQTHMGVSKNRGTPKSSILIGFSIINHPFWGAPIFVNIHIACRITRKIRFIFGP